MRYIEDGENENLLVLKTFKEVKPHSSEESEDKVVEGERDKYDIDEHYFLMGRAPARSRGWNLGWGWVVGR